VGGKEFDEIVFIAAQVSTPAQAQTGGIGGEQVSRVQGLEARVPGRIEGDAGDDAQAQAQTHVGLDHIRIDGGEDDVGGQALALKGLADAPAPGERRIVGDEGIAGQEGQGKGPLVQHRMAVRGNDAVGPLVAGHGQQLRKTIQGLGGNGQIRLPAGGPFRNLGGAALVDMQAHLGVALGKAFHHRRQGVAGLGMGGSHHQTARIPTGEFFPHPFQIFRFPQNAVGDFQHRLARLRNAGEALAATLENDDAQLVFQHLDLFGNPGLGGVKCLRRLGNIQSPPGDFHQVT